uniref:Guanylate kinase n=1 Tax=uncultured myxobacterium HF0070_11L13 TaxID=723554 RepID=E7C221_9BACT|nr:guanylate kinase [uncultured myxobacterium HF0070_11L13]
MRKGIPIVVSAASGTGKTSLCVRLLQTLSHVERSISYTTRAPRGEEVDGRDYYYVEDNEFDRMVQADEFLEWADVFGKKYGTGEAAVRKQLDAGVDVLLDIDVQGGLQVQERLPEAVLIFLLPPSMDELRRRLINRATDAPDEIERRLSEASNEMQQCRNYDYLVLNDDFDKAASDLRSIIVGARHRTNRNLEWVDRLKPDKG